MLTTKHTKGRGAGEFRASEREYPMGGQVKFGKVNAGEHDHLLVQWEYRSKSS